MSKYNKLTTFILSFMALGNGIATAMLSRPDTQPEPVVEWQQNH